MSVIRWGAEHLNGVLIKCAEVREQLQAEKRQRLMGAVMKRRRMAVRTITSKQQAGVVSVISVTRM